MTSFDVFESSSESSRPIEVYAFTLGTETFLFTSSEDEITLDSDTYTPQAISRSNIAQGPDDRRRILTVTVPAINEFARRYINVVPGVKAGLRIIRLQRDEVPTFDTQVLVFKGQVQSVRFADDGATAEIAVRSQEGITGRQIPRWTYMSSCNHLLYNSVSGCNANPDAAAFKLTATVTAQAGNVITVPGAGTKPDGWWAGGFINITSQADFRLVLAHVGDNLTLLLPFSGDPVGSDVTLRAGCNHQLTGDCSTKFDRSIDFGGFAFVPLRNPFVSPIA